MDKETTYAKDKDNLKEVTTTVVVEERTYVLSQLLDNKVYLEAELAKVNALIEQCKTLGLDDTGASNP